MKYRSLSLVLLVAIMADLDPAMAQELHLPSSEIPRLSDVERPHTSAQWLSQGVPVQIQGVQLNPTAEGIEVILETTDGRRLNAVTRVVGKALIADISNAVLALPETQEFRAEKPDTGISLITVTQMGENLIQVVVEGETAAPMAEILQRDQGWVLSLIPTFAQAEPEIKLVVTATRTEERQGDVPRSVTVVDREELSSQTTVARDLQDILGKTVPGLSVPRQQQYGPTLRGRNPLILIDGVPMSGNFTTGFIRDWRTIDPAAIEQVEVVRGPSAVYGDGATGGVINLITRKPEEGLTSSTLVGMNFSESDFADSVGYSLQHFLSGSQDNFDITVNFGIETSGDFFDGEGDRIPLFDYGASNSVTLNVLGKMGLDITEEQRLQFTINHFDDEQNYSFIPDSIVDTFTERVKARALEVGELRFIGTPKPGNLSTLMSLNYNHENVWGSELSVQTYYRTTQGWGAFFDIRPFIPDDPLPIARSVQKSSRFGARMQVETPVAEPVSLLWGIDYSSEDV